MQSLQIEKNKIISYNRRKMHGPATISHLRSFSRLFSRRIKQYSCICSFLSKHYFGSLWKIIVSGLKFSFKGSFAMMPTMILSFIVLWYSKSKFESFVKCFWRDAFFCQYVITEYKIKIKTTFKNWIFLKYF